MRISALFSAIAILFIFMTLSCGMESDKTERRSGLQAALEEGAKAQEFTLQDLNGKDVSLLEMRGKVILLNFWATWCPPCREEMPSMEKLHKAFDEEDLAVVAVAIDIKGEEVVRPYIDDNKFTFTVLIDKNGDVSDLYGVFAVPTTFIIGKDGIIMDKVQGGADWHGKEAIEYFEDLVGKESKA